MSLAHIPGSASQSEARAMAKDPLGHLSKLFEKHGPVFKTNLGSPVVFLVGPDANKAILTTHRDIFSWKEGYGASRVGELFANSLLTQDDQEAANTRAILAPGIGRLAMAENIQTILSLWEKDFAELDDGRSHEIHALFAKAGLEVAMVVQLGLDREDAYFEEINPLVQQLMDGARPDANDEVFKAALAARVELIERLIPRIERAQRNNPRALIGGLVHQVGPDGKRLTGKAIAENMLLLLWAGYDTFSATASWLFYELGNNPKWRAELWEEQRSALPVESRLTLEQINALEKHAWVIKEIERLWPIGVFFARHLLSDYDFEGFKIPRGTIACYSAYLTHRMPDLFPDPNTFKPERWDTKGPSGGAPSSALVGFGGGPRVCLGKSVAQLQLRLLLYSILSRYDVYADRDHQMKETVLSVHHPEGVHLFFKKRSPEMTRA